jgi:hypothetical protein
MGKMDMDMDKTVKQPESVENKRSVTSKLGDKVERVGEKLRNMGADKLGKAVYNTGNKIEHSKDMKK